jgi:hypothetical protein
MGLKSVIPWLTIPDQAVCAEIGVWRGDFSERIMRTGRVKELHLIDPWTFRSEFPRRLYGGSSGKNQANMDAIAEAVRQKFRSCSNVKIHRGQSVSVAQEFPDRYFDWIYIDGDHSYQSVVDDLLAWCPKVKIGRLVCLDDYHWRDEVGMKSVKAAIEHFLGLCPIGRARHVAGQFTLRVQFTGSINQATGRAPETCEF